MTVNQEGFMKKRLLVAMACAALLFVSFAPPAMAGVGENAVLIEILGVLNTMRATLTKIREAVAATKDTLNLTYPIRSLQEIRQVFDQVRTIHDEVQSLACGWHFSLRTQRLWDGLFGGVRMCKPEFQQLFGAPPTYVLQDLDEYFDYSATRRLNMVASRVERGPRQQEFLQWLLTEAKRGRVEENDPYGPGYSQRLSAVGASALGNVLLEQGDTITAQLELAQERANDRRLRQKMATELSLDFYRRLASSSNPTTTGADEVLR
jgi:hypothetical protein